MACECQQLRRHLALIKDAVEAVREAERVLPADSALREEKRELLALMERIEERLAALSLAA